MKDIYSEGEYDKAYNSTNALFNNMPKETQHNFCCDCGKKHKDGDCEMKFSEDTEKEAVSRVNNKIMETQHNFIEEVIKKFDVEFKIFFDNAGRPTLSSYSGWSNEDVKTFIRQSLLTLEKKKNEEFVNILDIEISEWIAKIANTPLDKRMNSFDDLVRFRHYFIKKYETKPDTKIN